MTDNLILIGMPGCGKSTVGVVLAKLLGMRFLDTDLLLQEQTGKRLPVLLQELGRDGFLSREAEAICSLRCSGTVIATGGSAVLTEEGAAALHALGRCIYLRVPLPALAERLGDLTSRGVAMEPGQSLADLYAERTPCYERCADLIVDEAATLEKTALQLAALVLESSC
jgi:shikimate kinase